MIRTGQLGEKRERYLSAIQPPSSGKVNQLSSKENLQFVFLFKILVRVPGYLMVARFVFLTIMTKRASNTLQK